MRKISIYWYVVTFILFGVFAFATNTIPNLVIDSITIDADAIVATNSLTKTITGNDANTVSGNYSQTVTGTMSVQGYSNKDEKISGVNNSITLSTMSTQVYGNRNEEVRGNYVLTGVGTMSTQVYGNNNRSVVGTLIDAVTGAITRTFSGGETVTITGNKAQTISGNYTNITAGTTSLNVGSNYNQVVAGSMSTTVSGNIDIYGRIVTASFNGAVTLKPQGDLTISAGGSGDVLISDQLAVGATTSPRGSAIAEFISGGAKALGLPVLTSAEQTALVNPLMGMLAYIRSTSLLEYYNGTAWTQLDTAANVPTVTDWVSYSVTIGGAVSAPTKSAVAIVDSGQWRRVGDSMEISYTYYHTADSMAANGSGTYLFSIPTTYTIDSTKTYIGTEEEATGAVGVAGAGTSHGFVKVYSSTNLALQVGNDAAAGQYVDSGFLNLDVSARAYTFKAIVPITGWTCCN